MSKHFFACDHEGKWHYMYPIYTEHQEKTHGKLYLEMKVDSLNPFVSESERAKSPNKWSECLFCKLDEQLNQCKNRLMPLKAAIELKLKELNGG